MKAEVLIIFFSRMGFNKGTSRTGVQGHVATYLYFDGRQLISSNSRMDRIRKRAVNRINSTSVVLTRIEFWCQIVA